MRLIACTHTTDLARGGVQTAVVVPWRRRRTIGVVAHSPWVKHGRVMTIHPARVKDDDLASGGEVEPTIYRIRVRGRLTERFGSALEGMRLVPGVAETVFSGEIRDQSQLYRLLDRVRDLGLELISVQPEPAGPLTDD
jgi:hypothetical protein